MRVEMFDRSSRPCHNGWWLCCCEYEAPGLRANHVDERCGPGDVPTHGAERFAKRSADQGNSIHKRALSISTNSLVDIVIEMFGHARPMRPVEADCMDFVQESNGSVLLGQINNLTYRSDGT